jgi:hypothetical protein
MMPTARWDRPQQLFGLIEQEEAVALEPLLGTSLYKHLLKEYDRLRAEYEDITATTVRPTGKAKKEAKLAHADVTERLEQIQQGKYRETYTAPVPGEKDVPETDMITIRLIRICQQIEFYRMLSHKAGMLSVSMNEGGGANRVSADGYEPADEKELDRLTRDAFMSAGRAVDSLLLFLEGDAKGDRLFTDLWSDADAFYLHKDLLFQTARVLGEYLDIKGERMAYVELVRDIRFCQNTYLKPRIGAKLLKAVVAFANTDPKKIQERITVRDGEVRIKADEGVAYRSGGQERQWAPDGSGEMHVTVDETKEGRDSGKLRRYEVSDDGMHIIADQDEEHLVPASWTDGTGDELLSMLRTALAFFVEARRVEIGPKQEKLARRDSMTDAQQAMAMACQFIEENLDALGEAAVGTPIYNSVRAKERQAEQDAEHREQAEQRRRREMCDQNRRKLFTGFPATHRTPEHKI